jgi:hypothetical protein
MAGMAGSSTLDRRTPVRCILHCMGRHIELPQIGDKPGTEPLLYVKNFRGETPEGKAVEARNTIAAVFASMAAAITNR